MPESGGLRKSYTTPNRSGGRIIPRSCVVQVAGNAMARGPLHERRLDLGAVWHRVRTARVEAAAARRVERTRHLASQDDLLARVVWMAGQRIAQEHLSIRM